MPLKEWNKVSSSSFGFIWLYLEDQVKKKNFLLQSDALQLYELNLVLYCMTVQTRLCIPEVG